ncbi:MAG: VanW family protein [Clostridia bacterium]|nr:VanW family protein [Clostridia bacterium]
MARMKHYDLYEGDGEIVGEEEAWGRKPSRPAEPSRARRADRILPEEEAPWGRTLPGKAPLGRDEELREKDEAARRAQSRYFAQNLEDDGLGAPPSLFDDFDRFNDPLLREEPRPRRKKKLKHRGAWMASILLSLAGILGAAYLCLPQLTGVRYRFLPNLAFANGSLLKLEAEEAEAFAGWRGEVFHDSIYPGIYIDDVHVGGMTKAQAVEALTREGDSAGADFNLTLTVGNQSWQVTPERVPVTRNVKEMVDAAWAMARGNTPGLRGSGRTPFQERVDRVSALRSAPVSLRTETTWDHAALRTLCEGIANYVNRDPVNSTVATFDFGTQTFTFTEDRPGAYLDPEQIYQKTAALLDAGDDHASLFLTPEKRIADVTKTELMNSFGLISTYTTKTTSNKNRNTNIQLSASAINGITVLPGETFSFNAATGERTAEKGYRAAAAISGGQSIEEIGGGVCQTSSTLFNAVARANLEIVERSPHAWPSSYVEKGFDATVNWPGLDFKFKNNTDWPIFIIADYASQKVTVSIYGMGLGVNTRIDLESVTTKTLPQPEGTNYVINTSLASGESKRTVTGRKGYVVETWKVWYQGEKEIRRELLFTTTYKAYQETIEYNPT